MHTRRKYFYLQFLICEKTKRISEQYDITTQWANDFPLFFYLILSYLNSLVYMLHSRISLMQWFEQET